MAMVVKLTGFETLPRPLTTYPTGRIALEGFIAENGTGARPTGRR